VFGLESREGVDVEDEDATPKMGFTRGRFLRGASSSVSWCDARSRFPKGEFLSPDMLQFGLLYCARLYFAVKTEIWGGKREKMVGNEFNRDIEMKSS
jgi:hypothetical protein